mgnify:CR=1 FL=1
MDDTVTDLHKYFDDFIEAYGNFSGERVASKFRVPFMAIGEGNVSRIFATHKDLAQYFQAFLDDYKSKGCVTCSYSNLQVIQLGAESAMASVSWHLCDGNENELLGWRESYLMCVGGSKPLAYATIDHVQKLSNSKAYI